MPTCKTVLSYEWAAFVIINKKYWKSRRLVNRLVLLKSSCRTVLEKNDAQDGSFRHPSFTKFAVEFERDSGVTDPFHFTIYIYKKMRDIWQIIWCQKINNNYNIKTTKTKRLIFKCVSVSVSEWFWYSKNHFSGWHFDVFCLRSIDRLCNCKRN